MVMNPALLENVLKLALFGALQILWASTTGVFESLGAFHANCASLHQRVIDISLLIRDADALVAVADHANPLVAHSVVQASESSSGAPHNIASVDWGLSGNKKRKVVKSLEDSSRSCAANVVIHDSPHENRYGSGLDNQGPAPTHFVLTSPFSSSVG